MCNMPIARAKTEGCEAFQFVKNYYFFEQEILYYVERKNWFFFLHIYLLMYPFSISSSLIPLLNSWLYHCTYPYLMYKYTSLTVQNYSQQVKREILFNPLVESWLRHLTYTYLMYKYASQKYTHRTKVKKKFFLNSLVEFLASYLIYKCAGKLLAQLD